MIDHCVHLFVADLIVTARAPEFMFTKAFIRFSVVDCNSMCSNSCVTYNGKVLKYILLLTLVLYNIEMMKILELL
jgi:hypothetical protein